MKKRGIIHIPLLNKFQYVDQQQPGHSIIGNNGYQVIDRSNERAGSYGRVNVDFLEEDRYCRTYQAGNHHRRKQSNAYTGTDRKREVCGIALEQMHVQTDEDETCSSQYQTVYQTHSHFLQDKSPFLPGRDVLIHQYTNGYSQ